MIIMPYEGFPAHKAGLKIGDEIIQVNGIDVKRKAYTDISKLLRGQANSSLKMMDASPDRVPSLPFAVPSSAVPSSKFQ